MQPLNSVTLALSFCQLLIAFQKANIPEENECIADGAGLLLEPNEGAQRGCTSKDAPIAEKKQNSEDKVWSLC
jgi:hypothetical protein